MAEEPRVSEQPTAPYLDAVVGYGFRGAGRFHVPGHKGGHGADPGLRHALGEDALLLDIPQDIRGVDVGPSPTPYERAELLALGHQHGHEVAAALAGQREGAEAGQPQGAGKVLALGAGGLALTGCHGVASWCPGRGAHPVRLAAVGAPRLEHSH